MERSYNFTKIVVDIYPITKIVIMECPICGCTRLVRNRDYFLVCGNCGYVFEDSNITYDSYLNFAFQDDWKARAEKIKKKHRFTHMGVVSSEPSDSKTASLVKYHLVEILRKPETSHLVQLVKEYCKPTSVNELFKDFLLSTGLPYPKALEIFRKAMKMAGARTKDLAPSTVLRKGAEKVRMKQRRARIENEYSEVRRLFGEKVERLTRKLSKYLQPVDPLATGAAIAVWLRLISRRKAVEIVGWRRLKNKIEKIRVLVGKPLPIIASISIDLSELRGVKRRSLRRARGLSYLERYAWAKPNSENGEFSRWAKLRLKKGEFLNLVCLDEVELVKYYKTYGGYVKACRKFGLKPLNYRDFLQEKWLQSIPVEKMRKALLEAIERPLPSWRRA